MQTDIHPDYPFIQVTLADGTEFTTRSTMAKEYRSEVDSSNHPFYTGKKTMVDTAGRVEKFMRRYGNAQAKSVDQDETPAERQAEAQEAIEQASAARAIDPGTPAPETKTADGPDESLPVPGTAKPPASSPENPARDTEGSDT